MVVKYKVKIKNEKLVVKVQIPRNEQFSQRELEVFSQKLIRGFLRPTQKNRRLTEYSGPQGESLDRYIKRGISEYDFYYLMVQVVDITKKIQTNKLFMQNLVLDSRYVYINPNTKELQFIYLPILSNHVRVDVLGFMEEIIYSAVFEAGEKNDFVVEYLNFIRGFDQKYDPDLILSYISQKNRTIENIIKHRNIGQSGFITDKRADYYNHYGDKAPLFDEATSLLDDEGTSLLDDDGATGLLEEQGTMLLDESIVMPLYREKPVIYPYLVRSGTGEIIRINKSVFRIGKEVSCVDYYLDNIAVSRKHADVITRGNHYFICDHNSTNLTYVDGIVIVAEVETEIFEGSSLKLANEEFEFHVH